MRDKFSRVKSANKLIYAYMISYKCELFRVSNKKKSAATIDNCFT